MVTEEQATEQKIFSAKNRKTNVALRSSRTDLFFDIIIGLVLIFASVVVLYPIVYIVSASFSSPQAVSSGAVVLWPVDFSLEGYKAVFQRQEIWTGYVNSVLYMVVGTLINVSITVMAAFALSQKDLPGKTVIMMIFTVTLLFSGGIIPLYLVVKNTIGVDNRWDMVIPNAMSVGNLIIARTFFRVNLPRELRESAKMDGSDDFRFFVRIAIPLSRSIIGVLVMLYALTHWNSFFFGFIFLATKKLFPLQIILRNILIMHELGGEQFQNLEYAAKMAGLNNLLKFSLIVVSSLPVLVLYPFVQRYFVKGVMIGSIKG